MATPRIPNSFKVVDKIVVQDSANVVCLRRRLDAAADRLRLEDCFPAAADASGGKSNAWNAVFGEAGMEFSCGWEVLLGQGEVINWLKSQPDKLTSMRYAGEFKPAGGVVDDGESVEEAARRELHEEFLRPVGCGLPDSARLRAFSVKQTRPIRSRSNIIYNFVALAEENPWLQDLDVDAVNEALSAHRRQFKELVESGKYWDMPPSERELFAPEIHQVAWVPLREAVRYCMQSMVPGHFVNEYQRDEFARYKKKARDPMFITAAALVELETFPTADALIRHSETVSLDEIRRAEQWLFTGMTAQDVDEAFAQRAKGGAGINPSFKKPEQIAQLRQSRSMGSARL